VEVAMLDITSSASAGNGADDVGGVRERRACRPRPQPMRGHGDVHGSLAVGAQPLEGPKGPRGDVRQTLGNVG
jgi:hypothetical protein